MNRCLLAFLFYVLGLAASLHAISYDFGAGGDFNSGNWLDYTAGGSYGFTNFVDGTNFQATHTGDGYAIMNWAAPFSDWTAASMDAFSATFAVDTSGGFADSSRVRFYDTSGNHASWYIGTIDSNLTTFTTSVLSSAVTLSDPAFDWSNIAIVGFGVGLSAGSTGGAVYTISSMDVAGAPVPEPSTYAAIFGFMALACAVVQRQRKAKAG